MEVEIKSMPEMRVGAVRHIGPYHQIGEAFERLHAIAARAGLFGQPAPVMLAIFHDDPSTTEPGHLRSDAALVFPANAPMPSGLTEERVVGGRYACTTHVGSYEHLGRAWAQLRSDWLPTSGERMRRASSYEIYLNTPATTPKEQLETEIYMPLE